MRNRLHGLSLVMLGAVSVFMASCGGGDPKYNSKVSSKTGWNYNDPKLGGFDVNPNFKGMKPGPGLVFVEGGRFTMGQTTDNPMMEYNNIPRTVSVSSFYMDETEVANVHYREYIYWLQRSYGSDFPDVILKALPDTMVWRSSMSYNEPMVEYYFTHASYNNYPVVGVNWNQANEYCKWRTDRVNEMNLIKGGYLKKNPNQVNEDVFDTRTYAYGQYEGSPKKKKRDFDPSSGGSRNIGYADGTLMPNYRLPTEAEWEYAALALVGRNPERASKRRRGEEVVTDRQVYPWGDSRTTRYEMRNAYQGEFLANFKRGNGDAMGVAGGLNDNADIPAPIYSYAPNAFGLYNMAGNVSEWTLDVYRPLSSMDVDDFRPYRGNEYDTYKRLEDGSLDEKDSLGRLVKRDLDTMDFDVEKRPNMLNSQFKNYKDGDSTSQYVYDYGRNTLINDKSRVIKGGSWADRAYWLSPSTRRYWNQDAGSATIGFRCIMDRLGSPDGGRTSGGNSFGKGK